MTLLNTYSTVNFYCIRKQYDLYTAGHKTTKFPVCLYKCTLEIISKFRSSLILPCCRIQSLISFRKLFKRNKLMQFVRLFKYLPVYSNERNSERINTTNIIIVNASKHSWFLFCKSLDIFAAVRG